MSPVITNQPSPQVINPYWKKEQVAQQLAQGSPEQRSEFLKQQANAEEREAEWTRLGYPQYKDYNVPTVPTGYRIKNIQEQPDSILNVTFEPKPITRAEAYKQAYPSMLASKLAEERKVEWTRLGYPQYKDYTPPTIPSGYGIKSIEEKPDLTLSIALESIPQTEAQTPTSTTKYGDTASGGGASEFSQRPIRTNVGLALRVLQTIQDVGQPSFSDILKNVVVTPLVHGEIGRAHV